MRRCFGVVFILCCLAVTTTAMAASLSDTARRGDFDELKQLIPQAADVNEVWGVFDRAALHWIGGDGPAELATMLLDKGAKVDLRDSENKTALHLAAEAGNIPVMEVLLDRGADINAKDKSGMTPLILVCRADSKRADVAALLLSKGADVNAGTDLGQTALMYLIVSKDYSPELINAILGGGADLNSQDNSGVTVLMHSIRLQDQRWQLSAALATQPNVDLAIADNKGDTALHYAAVAGYDDAGKLINVLMQKGANVNAQNKNGQTPLFCAVHEDRAKNLATLIINGKADVNLADEDGITVLHKAASMNNVSLMKFLIDNGADITAKAKNGQTVLFAAGNNAEAKELLQKSLPADYAATSIPSEVLVTELWSSVGDLYSGGSNLNYLKVDPNKTPFTGTAKQWHRNKVGERLKLEAVFKDGVPVSIKTYHDAADSAKESEQFIDGDYCFVNIYYPNGKPRYEERYVADKKTNSARKNYLKDGVIKEYHDNGFLAQEDTYVNGAREGLVKTYNKKDGALKEEYSMKDSQKVGPYKEYHPNGKLMKEVPYVEGREEGVRNDYRDDGTLSQSQEFKQGHPDGAKISYEKDGTTVKSKQMYKEGRPVNN